MSQKHHLQLHREALQRRTNQGKKSLEFNNGIQTGTNFTTILQIGQIENTYNCKSYLLIIRVAGFKMKSYGSYCEFA